MQLANKSSHQNGSAHRAKERGLANRSSHQNGSAHRTQERRRQRDSIPGTQEKRRQRDSIPDTQKKIYAIGDIAANGAFTRRWLHEWCLLCNMWVHTLGKSAHEATAEHRSAVEPQPMYETQEEDPVEPVNNNTVFGIPLHPTVTVVTSATPPPPPPDMLQERVSDGEGGAGNQPLASHSTSAPVGIGITPEIIDSTPASLPSDPEPSSPTKSQSASHSTTDTPTEEEHPKDNDTGGPVPPSRPTLPEPLPTSSPNIHCDACGTDFPPTKKALHRGPVWECTRCNQRLHGNPHTQEHQCLERPPEPKYRGSIENFYCGICDATFPAAYQRVHTAKKWKCRLCDITTHRAWKSVHCAGREHTEKQAAQTRTVAPPVTEIHSEPECPEFYCGSCDEVITGLGYKPERHYTTPWRCDACEQMMHITDKEGHERGGKHRERMQQIRAEGSVPAAALNRPTAVVNRPTASMNRPTAVVNQPTAAVKRPARSGRFPAPTVYRLERFRKEMWTCPICYKTMLLSNKSSHESGSAHRTRERRRQTTPGAPLHSVATVIATVAPTPPDMSQEPASGGENEAGNRPLAAHSTPSPLASE